MRNKIIRHESSHNQQRVPAMGCGRGRLSDLCCWKGVALTPPLVSGDRLLAWCSGSKRRNTKTECLGISSWFVSFSWCFMGFSVKVLVPIAGAQNSKGKHRLGFIDESSCMTNIVPSHWWTVAAHLSPIAEDIAPTSYPLRRLLVRRREPRQRSIILLFEDVTSPPKVFWKSNFLLWYNLILFYFF